MTRNHYIELAKYLLERAFTHARSLDDPVTFPMVPGRNYPQEGSPDWRFRSPEFEALERSFILAGPLIHIEPQVTIRGINLRGYYNRHLYNALTPGTAGTWNRPDNYYSISLFIVYTTIWNRAFGDEHYPELATTVERSAQKLMESITRFLGRDGCINMWSRSICCRTWVSGAFPVAFMLKSPGLLDPGLARRLCSGSLLQFTGREDFYQNNIPSLGFYGRREYMIQN